LEFLGWHIWSIVLKSWRTQEWEDSREELFKILV